MAGSCAPLLIGKITPNEATLFMLVSSYLGIVLIGVDVFYN